MDLALSYNILCAIGPYILCMLCINPLKKKTLLLLVAAVSCKKYAGRGFRDVVVLS